MASKNEQEQGRQKLKLLKLLELLRKETDEEHPMTTQQICDRLAEEGIPCDRRTLAKDVQLLNEYGYEVMITSAGHSRAFYVEESVFSIPELKVLIDAVQGASFLTEKKSRELMQKLSFLAGGKRSEVLSGGLVRFNTRKHTNEQIYYNVSVLEEALREKKQAGFLYFDLNERGEKVYRKERRPYAVEPLALVFHEDNYYLLCYSSKYKDLCTYRVDRMSGVNKLPDPISRAAIRSEKDVAEAVSQMFRMFSGRSEMLLLGFDPSLIGAVYDKFGEQTPMTRVDDHTVTARVTVQISPTFWGWLFQFAGDMRILAPESAAQEYRERCERAAKG